MTLDKMISQLEALRNKVGGDVRIGVYTDNETGSSDGPTATAAYNISNIRQIKYLLYTGGELVLDRKDDRYDFYIASYPNL